MIFSRQCPSSSKCLLNSSSRFLTTRTKASPTSITPSTSSASSAPSIPPESPKFIQIPKSLQEQAIYLRHVKGVLPVPREIFPKNLRKDKTSPEYLQASTPEPKPHNLETQLSHTDPRIAYKARQAVHRRRNLRESIVELYDRKKRIERQVAIRSANKQATALRLQRAPPLDSERFTAPSISTAMLPSARNALPDPDRTTRVAEQRARTIARQEEREENRRNMMHSLYMNASSFITTPAQLEAVVDRVFDDTDQFTTDTAKGENIWNLGYPETVQNLLNNMKGSDGGKVVDRVERSALLTKERMDRIAEELTGGKLRKD